MNNDSSRTLPVYLPVQTKRAFEEVAEQIREQLSLGLLKPGDRLPPERELAERFGLSRNTVREALRALEMSGLLELRKGATGGAFIREGQSDAVISGFNDLYRLGYIRPDDLAEARLIVGVEIARLACHRATEEELSALEANLDASDTAAANGDDAQRLQTNLNFHALLAKAARNPVLIILIDALNDIHQRLLRLMVPAENTRIVEARRRIVRYLREKDEEGAVRELREHLIGLRRYYKAQEAQSADQAIETTDAAAETNM
ncbi:FadR/GntR family transcriptional regulator [Pseudomonas typographi]|uniref:FadR family transcriptional regulator n=1 Tax=Pseudomonas typographi TaxID=2715964 RepID=A0ABR7YY30_9PSED|nr:FCD domain-containing protein [Pseudomonas typographi]MBD1550417.1 FadR family transcriptional regulator [Pseudomonas typographi]MBD1587906.1 FadR family transcriptional regulator [Pseudomonas typographi]MBD1598114.1 FadR family transcriptional regulator [Pseudomonas typographi]